MVRTISAIKSVQLEDYYLMRAVADKAGAGKHVIGEKETEQAPTLQDIATFLIASGADFVSVEHNYREHRDDDSPFF